MPSDRASLILGPERGGPLVSPTAAVMAMTAAVSALTQP
jgi:hypothetical protein